MTSIQANQSSRSYSIYTATGLIIFFSILSIFSLFTLWNFVEQKHHLDADLKLSAHKIVASLEEQIKDFIAAYAVQEYDKILLSEIKHFNLLAITLNDNNMAKLTGQQTFERGYIRLKNHQIVAFDSNSTDHQHLLANSYYHYQTNLQSSQGKNLGNLTVYLSNLDTEMQLQNMVMKLVIYSIGLGLLLMLTLFLLIRWQLIGPILHIRKTLMQADSSGILASRIPEIGPREIVHLSVSINHLFDAIVQAQHTERARNHDLEIEKDRFRLAIEGTSDGLWDWNLETNQIYRSTRYETMLGYEPCELEIDGNNWTELIHPEDQKTIKESLNRYLLNKTDQALEMTFRMRGKNGHWLWIRSRGKALFNSKNQAIRFIGFNTDITQHLAQTQKLEDNRKRLEFQANHDTLTQLYNHNVLVRKLDNAITNAQQSNRNIAILFIDLDHFKEINDSLGHDIGDKVLVLVAQRLLELLPMKPTLARLGGDEFILMLEDYTDQLYTSKLAQEILNTLEKPYQFDDLELHLGASIGISLYPENGKNASDLLKNADAAMYRAKSEGRNNFQYYSEQMTLEAFDRLQMETNIRNAIQNQEFEVYYQPQVNGEDETLSGMEALVRWNSPTLGFVSPARFIPVAVATGAIIELDRYVMTQAVNQFAQWHQKQLNPPKISMNLNMKQIRRPDFLEFLQQLLATSGCDVKYLELEVTEDQIMEDPEWSIRMLNEIVNLGFSLALDDFGTGYSSLSYLKKLPIQKLKIDQSFVRDLLWNKEDAEICRAIIEMAKSLHLKLIAEGTEELAQAKTLMEMGCDQFQGYYYGKPMPAAAMETFIKQHGKS